MANGPQTEYTNLVAYFKHLVWLTLGALTIIVAAGGLIFYSNMRDLRADVTQKAMQIATDESRNAVRAAFDEKNITQQIQKAAQEKIGSVTDKMIEQQLTSKLHPIEKRILAIGQISEIEITIRKALRSGLEELTTLIANTNDPDTLQFARSTLQTTSQDFESSMERQTKAANASAYHFLRAFMNRPNEGKTMPDNLPGVVEVISKDQDLNDVALAFLAFRELTGEKVKMFDFGAVKRWCTNNEAKCK